jgi:hypothetical protein
MDSKIKYDLKFSIYEIPQGNLHKIFMNTAHAQAN